MKSMGRPTKWTEEIKQSILKYIENGATFKRACIVSGVSRSIFYEWKKQGEKDRENGETTEYTDFLDKIDEAQEKYIIWLQQSVNNQALHDGKLALDVLQRIRPKEFGKKDFIKTQNEVEIKIIPPKKPGEENE